MNKGRVVAYVEKIGEHWLRSHPDGISRDYARDELTMVMNFIQAFTEQPPATAIRMIRKDGTRGPKQFICSRCGELNSIDQ
jgi:hypothetical protein